MNGDNNNKSERKGFPGGFLFFLLAVFLIVLTVQNFNSEKNARVSFSYQVEHLTNLDLIQKDESRKVALNDNLVTFSGVFKDKISDEAKARYRYLEVLNKNDELNSEIQRLQKEIGSLRQSVNDSAQWFLQITGITLPKNGYVVIDQLFNTPQLDNSVTVNKVEPSNVVTLMEMQKRVTQITSADQLDGFKSDLLKLIQEYRSPVLGIGDESMKEQLRDLELAVVAMQNSETKVNQEQQITVCKNTLVSLRKISADLNSQQDSVRLSQLRSVRNYKALLEQYTAACEELDKNTAQLDKARQSVANVTWYFNNKELSTRALEKQDPEAYSQWFAQAKQEWDNFPNNRGAVFKAPDQPRNLVLDKTFKSEEPAPNYFSYLLTLLPVILVVLLLYFVFSRQMKGVGSSAMSFGKSPAKLLTKEKNKITFKDVAGCDEAKEELQEIVDFLKDPTKFTALGARIPKGVLCVGAPGTGKTLIAKAVAGEADRPFFTISGSDFVEMFVGVGASRIRDLFDQAKKQAPCIIFMDEIDAVGRHRGAGIGGGHDEREQTLNQLLVEMDGFDTSEGVILIAATNRPDVLDKALLRPGRFDRRIVIDLPDVKGRLEILKVHARKIKLDPAVDLMNVARNTPGSSGADLSNILNEAALLAARKGRSAVIEVDVAEACDKVRYGKERRSLELDMNEKKTTAYHESGHAVVALVVKHSDSVDKVTIIPRGMSLGATHFMPKKNRVSYWKNELLDQLAILMGGRVAEEVFVGDVSSGAQMDITQAT
ncbi:MAG: ATP-dependent zinc metalloprotease FtsH, partial [Chlamydiae bacterium]|nr:ATP-dependent zinc metalloprotease FtsH [Chlamydiota bacterium]